MTSPSGCQLQVVYLTGAPATGKSTVARALIDRVQPLQVYHYSDLLIDYLKEKKSETFLKQELRSRSASVITPEDVDAVDRLLIDDVCATREYSHVLIDSHPVTKECYGYRVTPFSFSKLRELQPTIVCILYAESEEIIRRIEKDNSGRATGTKPQIDFHNYLQLQVALAYSMELDLPLYVFDTTESIRTVSEKLSSILS